MDASLSKRILVVEGTRQFSTIDPVWREGGAGALPEVVDSSNRSDGKS